MWFHYVNSQAWPCQQTWSQMLIPLWGIPCSWRQLCCISDWHNLRHFTIAVHCRCIATSNRSYWDGEQLLVKFWIKQSTAFPWFIFVDIVVQLLNLSDFFVTPWSTACQTPLSFTISWSLLKFMSIESVVLSNLISSSAALFSFAFNLSQHQGRFQWVVPLHQMAKVLELQQQSFQWIFRTDFL